MKDALQQSRWTELLSNKESFAAFLSFIREQKVRSIDLDGIKIEFQQATYVSKGEPKIEPLPELTDEQKKKEEDSLLFYSSGA